MPRYLAEPKYRHDATEKVGILLINLGTPAEPTAAALRPYLKQFLSDPRVVEITPWLWKPLLNLVILNTRPKKSAAKYAQVWTSEGSPLRFHTEKQAKLLQGYFANAGDQQVLVEYAMRYGNPSVATGIASLKAKNCTRILAVPLYPQYAASSTASAMDAVASAMTEIRNLPELRLLRSFGDDPGYIKALAATVNSHWGQNGRADKLVISFHGVPRFSLDKGDPYHCECHKTARLLAETLRLQPEDYVVSFQSRFGRAEWLKPYTQPLLEDLAKTHKTVDIICPGFVSDCLETLEEIAMECKVAFVSKGGKDLRYIPCLNESHDWISALHAITRTQIQDWLARPTPTAAALQSRAQRASQLGAPQ